MKKILVVATFNNHFRFFCRLAKTLRELDFETHFVTNKYSILKEAITSNVRIHGLKKIENSQFSGEITNSFEVAAESITHKNAEKIAGSVKTQLEKILDEDKYEYIFIWGGVRLIELVSAKVAAKRRIKTLFFELGNFPNKIFVDPNGTNAQSLLSNKPGLLATFDYDINDYRKWHDRYLADGLKKHLVPQSSSAVNVEYSKNIKDLFGFYFKKLIQNEALLTKNKLVGKYLRKVVRISYDEVDLKTCKYIFYPMQVNMDAQLILNSEVGNLEALEIANRSAKENGLTLLVKPHPGEVEFGFIKKVNNLKEKLGFKFVNENTIDLINNASEVVTINSTVGLQAKILNKKVTCLGKAFYNEFDENKLATYIQSYLVNADFWGEANISLDSAKRILDRAELN